MRSSRAVGALLLTGTLLLTGCATDARGELREAVADFTDATNDRDAEAIRSSADTVLERLRDAVRANELITAEAARIDELTRLTRDRALAAFAEPEPEPEPAEPEPEPTVEPSPEATTPPPSPSPSPSPPSPPPAPSPAPSPPPPSPEPVLPEVPTG